MIVPIYFTNKINCNILLLFMETVVTIDVEILNKAMQVAVGQIQLDRKKKIFFFFLGSVSATEADIYARYGYLVSCSHF